LFVRQIQIEPPAAPSFTTGGSEACLDQRCDPAKQGSLKPGPETKAGLPWRVERYRAPISPATRSIIDELAVSALVRS